MSKVIISKADQFYIGSDLGGLDKWSKERSKAAPFTVKMAISRVAKLQRAYPVKLKVEKV